MINPYTPENAVIRDIKRQTYDTKTYTLSFENEQKRRGFSFKPGQFIMVSLLGIGEAAFSPCSDPAERENFEITVRAVGNVTETLDRLNVGDVVGVRGPYGTCWPLKEAKNKNILTIAGGLGINPIRPVLTYVAANRDDYGDVEILYGAKTPDDLFFTYEFDDWRRMKNTRLLLTVNMVPKESTWKNNVGVVTTLFEKMRASPDNTVALTCGPEIMMRFVVKGLIYRGFTSGQIFVSLERRIKCGIGICGHCQLGTKFVCKEGPVFRYADVKGLPDSML